MAISPPEPITHNPFVRMANDIRDERRASGGFPPGPTRFSVRRTAQFTSDPLPILLACYERFGPVFSVRVLHARHVFMIGPEATHFVTVSGTENFIWREGELGQLIPLLGDGLLTIDGEYHDRARKLMVPAFHSRRVAGAVGTMVEEAERAIAGWEPGDTVDIYGWMRELAMRIAMRALLGLDPDDGGTGARAAEHFERALGFLGSSVPARIVRGPGTPWRKMIRSRAILDEIIFSEIARRRAHGNRPDSGGGDDILSLLIDARDEDDGAQLSDVEIRDQTMTLLFAGHDTSTSTLTFMAYELARNPGARERLADELDEVLDGQRPTAEQITGALPVLGMTLDETLRMYPPAWIGPRKSVRAFEFDGHHIPANSFVNYCSWATHHLPDVFDQPFEFRPRRFSAEAAGSIPRGAYVPFGGGSRICIGKRFGQVEIKAVAALVFQRFRLELPDGHRLKLRQMPTLSPRGGLPMRLEAR